MLNLDPLLSTLSKLSDDRIVPRMVTTSNEGEVCKAVIAVVRPNIGDKTDTVLRRYSKDWLKTQGEFSVDARFTAVSHQSWFDDDGTATPICGIITLMWWPRPPLSDYEKWEQEKANRARARVEDRKG